MPGTPGRATHGKGLHRSRTIAKVAATATATIALASAFVIAIPSQVQAEAGGES